MANLTIIDTGYPNIREDGSQASRMANNGNAIALQSADIDFQIKANTDNSPIPGKYDLTEINYGSIENERGTITGLLKRDVSADMTQLEHLRRLVKTIGVKLLYYSSTTDGYRDLTDSLNTGLISGSDNDNSADIHKTTRFGGTATPHFHVRFLSFSVRQTSQAKLLRYSLAYEVTA